MRPQTRFKEEQTHHDSAVARLAHLFVHACNFCAAGDVSVTAQREGAGEGEGI
jgi:hypothetical protein